MKRCIIFGAGDFDADRVIGKDREEVIKSAKENFCITADGGLEHAYKIGVLPNLIIGDMDSIKNRQILDEFRNQKDSALKELPQMKDDTDMLAAIKEGLLLGCDYFEIYGALGGRTDHTVANIQCLLYLSERGAYGILHGTGLRMELIKNTVLNFPKEMYNEKRRVSAFAWGAKAEGVTETGLKYKLDNAVLTPDFPLGVSNEFTGKESSISVKNGMLLVCIED